MWNFIPPRASNHDLNPLTPHHFLIGEYTSAIPERDVREIPWNRLNQYQKLTGKRTTWRSSRNGTNGRAATRGLLRRMTRSSWRKTICHSPWSWRSSESSYLQNRTRDIREANHEDFPATRGPGARTSGTARLGPTLGGRWWWKPPSSCCSITTHWWPPALAGLAGQ